MGHPNEATPAFTYSPAPPPYSQSDANNYGSNYYHPPPAPAQQYVPHEPHHAYDSQPGRGGQTKFPPALNGYIQKVFSTTLHLGPTKDSPLYAVRMHTGMTKNPEQVMHDGPSDKYPVLATANRVSMWKPSRTALTIAARDGVTHDEASECVEMEAHTSFKTKTFTFEADVGPGKETHRERFEWRPSHGAEIRELDGYKWGWKLVRVSNAVAGGGGSRATRAAGSASDGSEVVAVWAHNGMSMTKALKFQFRGSALTGILGDRWATLAIISAVRIWWLEMQSASAGASSGAASTVTGILSS
ncbi:hypothetical protein F5Y17DRAFT_422820 [Xylariaceae sp. FL0594]|nr:hypothetical protein F5Y17DRAFT_422820 [Xylariaceae sp. FL0594]